MGILSFIFLQISLYQSCLDSLIKNFKNDPKTSYTTVSVSIRQNSTGKEIYSYNSEVSLAPASTLKLFTTATALKVFGSDYRFVSDVGISGHISNDTLKGNLIINCNHNPSFGSQRFGKKTLEEIIKKINEKKIKVIAGKVIVNQDIKNQVQENWPLGDVGNYYGAYPRFFNYNENMYSFFFEGGQNIGEDAKIIKTWPILSDSMVNEVKTGALGTGDQVNFYHSTFGGPIFAKGTVPLKSKNFEIKASMIEPAKVFENSLMNEFKNHQITLLHQNLEDHKFESLYSEVSPSMFELVKECNHKSVNFIADALLESILRHTKHDSFFESLNTIYKDQNLDFTSFILNDGSGMSPSNTMNVSFFSDYLQKLIQSSPNQNFVETLPTWGKSGTVAGFDKNKKTKGLIKVKSGSVQGVRNYAGLFTNNGQDYSFVIFTNGLNDTARSLYRNFIENFMIKMIDINQL